MKEYFAYIRVSTVKQGHKGVSLQEQREAIQRYADRKHIVISRWFEERQTAAKCGRPVFGAMLKLLRKRSAAGVILHRVDRGTRNFRDWADLGELGDLGVEVHIAMEDLDLSSRSGRLAADIQVVIAADFIRNLRDETKKGIYGRLKQGLYPLPAPIGYVDNGPGKLKTIDPAIGPVVALAFELYSTGEYSLQRLRLELAQRGLTNSKGAPISKSMMGRLLNNPFYTGVILIKKTGETFQGAHEPLISPVQFAQVQQLLKGKTVKKVCRHTFTYKRLLECAHCHRFLIGERQKGHVYYRCRNEACAGSCVSEKLIDEQIRDALSPIRISAEEARFLVNLYDAAQSQEQSGVEAARRAIELRIRQAEQRQERLTDLLIDGALANDDYKKRKKQILLDIAQAKRDRSRIASSRADQRERFEKMCELAQSPVLSHFSANSAEAREILKKTCANFLVDRKKLSVELYFGFDLLAKRSAVPTGCPLSAIVRTLNKPIEINASTLPEPDPKELPGL